MWYNGQNSDSFLGLAEPGIHGLGAVRRTRLPVTQGDDRVRTEAQIDKRIAALRRACERRRGRTFQLISRAPLQYQCNAAPAPAPVPQPTPEPGLPTPPGTVVAPGLDKLPRGRLLRLLNDARRECRKKGGHLTIKSLRPLEYTCEYFGGPPAPVVPPPYTGPGPQVTAPADSPIWPQGGGIYTPSPSGGPTFDTAGGGVPGGEYDAAGQYDTPGQYPVGPSAPGLPSGAPGGPMFDPIPEGMQPEEEFQTDTPSYPAATSGPSLFSPYEEAATVDICDINAPEHTSDEFGPLNTLQIVCASPPAAAAPSGGYDIATVPQSAVEYGDIQAMEASESSMFGMGAPTYEQDRIKKCRRIQRTILKIESAMRSNDAKLRALFAKYGYTTSNPPLGVMSPADQKIFQELFMQLRSLDEQHRMAFNLSIQFRCAEVNFGERPDLHSGERSDDRDGMNNIVLLGRYIG